MTHLGKLVVATALVLSASACTRLSDADQATLSMASQNAAAAKQEADQALAASQQALDTAKAAQASAAAAAAAAQTASDKADRIFQRGLRKP